MTEGKGAGVDGRFQSSFVEWNLLLDEMVKGTNEFSAESLRILLNDLSRYYPESLEPRLTPSFRRLCLYVDGVLSRHPPPGMDEIKVIKELMWEFWSTFCLFLSIRYNDHISDKGMDRYRQRAEQKITAYKRRLTAALESAYLSAGEGARLDDESLKTLSSLLEDRILSSDNEG